MLHLYQSNNLRLLTDAFYKTIIQNPPQDPLKKDYVVVQTPGMEKWLTLETAQRGGVCAQLAFSNPTKFLMKLEFLLSEQREKKSVYDKPVLKWAINQILLEKIESSDYHMLREYLGEEDDAKLFRLSVKIADLFDQYLIYRPVMLDGWNRGKRSFPDNPYEEWQMALWREIRTRYPEAESRVDVIRKLHQNVKERRELLPRYLQRVSLFGMSILPPYYFDVLQALAEQTEVLLFMQNPSREYWGDQLSDKTKSRIGLKTGKDPLSPLNPFLDNFGLTGKEFFDLIYEKNPVEHELPFYEPEERTLLERIQGQILRCEEPDGKTTVRAKDDSLHIAVCHSALREVEVLFDYLADAFHRNPDLTPGDVLVVTPDIEKFAPYVEMVFGSGENGKPPIPYRISDRSFLSYHPVARIVQTVLALIEGRFLASEMLSLFEEIALFQPIAVSPEHLESIRRWIGESGIRWGIDAGFRERIGLPAGEAYTWEKGLRRMLLGYALEENGEAEEVVGELPYDRVEGEMAEVLGKLISFVRAIEKFYRFSLKKHAVGEWTRRFQVFLSELFFLETPPEKQEKEDPVQPENESLLNVFKTMDSIASEGRLAGYKGLLSWSLFKAVAEQELESLSSEQTLLSGRVSFASMIPMRSIPFKIIAMLGMNHGQFPRRNTVGDFNLMKQEHKRGDRNVNAADRYLFLEMLLSARERMYLSYTGRDERDNSVKPPSAVLLFLREYLEKYFEDEDHKSVVEKIEKLYPLQPFSSRYGNEAGLRSYNGHWFEETAARDKISPFAWEPIRAESSEEGTVDGNTIESLLLKPQHEFLRRSLATRFPPFQGHAQDSEPFEADALLLYRLKSAFLEDSFSGKKNLDKTLRQFRAGGLLPPGGAENIAVNKARADCESLLERLKGLVPLENLETLSVKIDTTVEGIRYLYQSAGFLKEKNSGEILIVKPAAIKGKYRLSAWIVHLFLNLQNKVKTTLLCQNSVRVFDSLSEDQAAEYILQLYVLSETTLEKPRAFDPEASWEYLRRILKPGPRERGDPLGTAMNKLFFSPYGYEKDQTHTFEEHFFYSEREITKNADFQREFTEMAMKAFGPVLNHGEEESWT